MTDFIWCAATANTASQYGITPPAGLALTGNGQMFAFASPFTSQGAVTAVIAGITGTLPITLANGANVPRGLIVNDGVVIVRKRANASLELVSPEAVRTNVVPLERTNTSLYAFATRPRAGVIAIDPAQAEMTLIAPADRLTGAFSGVSLEVEGLNSGDPRQVRYYPGNALADQIGEQAWHAGDELRFSPITANGIFLLLHPPRPQTVAPSSLSKYQTIALRAARQRWS